MFCEQNSKSEYKLSTTEWLNSTDELKREHSKLNIKETEHSLNLKLKKYRSHNMEIQSTKEASLIIVSLRFPQEPFYGPRVIFAYLTIGQKIL